MSFELHIWGALSEHVPSFDPECLAACWLLSLAVGNDDFEVVASSNVCISETGQLPALRHDGNVVAGFSAIVGYLERHGYRLSSGDGQEARMAAAMEYIGGEMGLLSQYVLYLSSANYEQVTRPLFTRLVPFPMQYNLSVYEKGLAKQMCTEGGLVGSGSSPTSSAGGASATTVISKLQEQIEAANKQKRLGLDEAKASIRLVTRAQRVYETVLAFAPTIQHSFLFGAGPTPPDLLLLAHLQLHMWPQLPDSALRALVSGVFPDMAAYLARGLGAVLPLQSWRVKEPAAADAYSLQNAVLRLLG